jgi:putative transposase
LYLTRRIIEADRRPRLDVLPGLISTVINTAMQIERQQYLNAGPNARTTERRGQANGYKPKTVTTRGGQVTFDVPQV